MVKIHKVSPGFLTFYCKALLFVELSKANEGVVLMTSLLSVSITGQVLKKGLAFFVNSASDVGNF